jgi:hypothetical protein
VPMARSFRKRASSILTAFVAAPNPDQEVPIGSVWSEGRYGA